MNLHNFSNKALTLGKRKVSFLLESLYLQKYPIAPKNSPIFIMGLPRSGTTLLYQYIVHRLNVSYYMNGSDKWPYAAVLNTLIRYNRYGDYISDFDNEYGKVPGPNAPHEAGSFWGRFFGVENYITYQDVNLNDEDIIKKSISAVEQIFGNRPFINKNIKHLFRIQALANIFPNAYFIIIYRDLNNVGLSLLRGRYKNLGRADQWWSARPPNWKELDDMEPPVQIAHQLISLRNKMNKDIKELSKDRIHHIQYEEFCNNPERLVLEISNKFQVSKRTTEAVEQFAISKNIAQTDEEKMLIKFLKNG